MSAQTEPGVTDLSELEEQFKEEPEKEPIHIWYRDQFNKYHYFCGKPCDQAECAGKSHADVCGRSSQFYRPPDRFCPHCGHPYCPQCVDERARLKGG